MCVLLTLKNISKSFQQQHALKNVSLSIPKGICYGLIGPNGAGKSTLMKIIATIIKADQGEVIYQSGKDAMHVKQHIGYIPQDICLEESLTAVDNLRFFGRIYGLKGKALQYKVEESLSYVGLTDKGTQKVKTFSGGMKRRLNIGCALLNEPNFLLMDEPTVGIDPQSRRYIFELIKDLKQAGCTILYTSHYIEEIEQLCDDVALIDHGKIIESGSLDDLLHKHAKPSVFVKGKKQIPDTFHTFADIHEESDGYFLQSDKPLHVMNQVVSLYEDDPDALSRLELLQPRLEDIFFSLTGNQLRDE